jgi:REP element-mobilizing transposase RayT
MSKQFPDRKRIRLKEYDYSKPGNYFVTINTKEDVVQLSSVENGTVKLSEAGEIVDSVWRNLPNHYTNCELDEYIIMPDHFHGIIIIIDCCREGSVTLPKNEKTNKTNHGLPEIIRGFKTFSSKTINERIQPVPKFSWQKSYHDRIIRNKRELDNVRKYIIDNPNNWDINRNNLPEINL